MLNRANQLVAALRSIPTADGTDPYQPSNPSPYSYAGPAIEEALENLQSTNLQDPFSGIYQAIAQANQNYGSTFGSQPANWPALNMPMNPNQYLDPQSYAGMGLQNPMDALEQGLLDQVNIADAMDLSRGASTTSQNQGNNYNGGFGSPDANPLAMGPGGIYQTPPRRSDNAMKISPDGAMEISPPQNANEVVTQVNLTAPANAIDITTTFDTNPNPPVVLVDAPQEGRIARSRWPSALGDRARTTTPSRWPNILTNELLSRPGPRNQVNDLGIDANDGVGDVNTDIRFPEDDAGTRQRARTLPDQSRTGKRPSPWIG
ncbi:hypothetical protein DRE_00396 [Drechslerella stenobrocha 248]|uniref:Uncharacterized protein n=1 Tax=Drechslerella stenobrocha 248 TaxID=1043628 RepID=W7I5G6_9PEZI|nr:hypothetical protein DRE_00396 [Drechslerella stenobrocha 248]